MNTAPQIALSNPGIVLPHGVPLPIGVVSIKKAIFDKAIDVPAMLSLQQLIITDLQGNNLALSSKCSNFDSRLTELAQRNAVLQSCNSELNDQVSEINNQARLANLKKVNEDEVSPDVALENKVAELESDLVKVQVDLDVSVANLELAEGKVITANRKKNNALDSLSTANAKMDVIQRQSHRVHVENGKLTTECSDSALELLATQKELSLLKIEHGKLVESSKGEPQRRANFLKLEMSKINSGGANASELSERLSSVELALVASNNERARLLKENDTLINITNSSISDVKNAITMSNNAIERYEGLKDTVVEGSVKLAFMSETLLKNDVKMNRYSHMNGILQKMPAYEHGGCFLYLLSTGTSWLKPQYRNTEYPIYMHLDQDGYGRMLFIHDGELLTLDGKGIDFIAAEQVEPIKKSIMRFSRVEYTRRMNHGAQIALEMAVVSGDAPTSKERSELLSEVADYIKSSAQPKEKSFTAALDVIEATCRDNQNRISMMLRESKKAKKTSKANKSKRRKSK
ncbi:hypothetical protein HWV00_20960 (plasmid) [Moritella sp. 24]|uniref:hypothetical protein n=1 Tax=Moritella sp. 24 TaxID=2746230 RepID=UPI001BA57E5F|nr:hypothetical protein [Moritella sp. 24]QUM78745.1 hypothetical protein HWV00_20960 [Moritella sp. 24]